MEGEWERKYWDLVGAIALSEAEQDAAHRCWGENEITYPLPTPRAPPGER
jgi:hypothetical protein